MDADNFTVFSQPTFATDFANLMFSTEPVDNSSSFEPIYFTSTPSHSPSVSSISPTLKSVSPFSAPTPSELSAMTSSIDQRDILIVALPSAFIVLFILAAMIFFVVLRYRSKSKNTPRLENGGETFVVENPLGIYLSPDSDSSQILLKASVKMNENQGKEGRRKSLYTNLEPSTKRTPENAL